MVAHLTINFYFIAPYFGSFVKKENGAFISVSFYWLFAQAHYESGYEKEKPSPIVYYTFTTLR
jgi:hypothetical protein